ncbi:uncharacterized protein LOC9636329 [Selaginella moellendorffii]|uniref:uncharacterized protein LOC9636329 n=1 Tax=Selaginella moellendorffii TaxID=88036 RepID=UPI000D1C59A2|nr:uncharacterized protein LOC9636329 [Selaginella moellendorffii]|eukprot:XP_024517883.1 uncharacterized protein LOC9636329 [Selaginella moellendorffii]
MSVLSEDAAMTDPDQEELYAGAECIAAASSSAIAIVPPPNLSNPQSAAANPSSSRASSVMMMPVDPEPHMSSQFYTFNRASHRLMVRCLMAGRHPSPDEIRGVATPPVLASWRGVWKDRHEDTAYLTGWRRIQDKLQAQVDDLGNEVLFFKSNPYQFVPFIEQWGGIVQQFHIRPDLKHLGCKETLERMRDVWTVGAKVYGVPESYVKVCISTCPVCGSSSERSSLGGGKSIKSIGGSGDAAGAGSGSVASHAPTGVGGDGGNGGGGTSTAATTDTAAAAASAALQQSRRKRFEYTESFEVVARDVPQRLQHLAAKYKVVLCIRQKYIRYKPFLAEVKDYCCHRGGEPTGRKPGVLKRKRYMSKRCGCSFRIRAIVPITNYDEKEKTFAYQEEGVATFKLYAVHSGHEPGPHEGSARVIHRFVDPNSISEELAAEKEEDEARQVLLRQIQELQMELGSLEQRLGNTSVDVLNSVCQDVSSAVLRLRSIDKAAGAIVAAGVGAQQQSLADDMSLVEHWSREDEMSREADTKDDAMAKPSSRRRPAKKAAEKAPTLSCTRCCCKADVLLETGYCKNCETLLRQPSEDGGLSSYCAENDKWYEGMGCGLDATHAVELGFGHAIS